MIVSVIAAWVFSSVPLAANAQSRADSVAILIQAARVAVDSMAPTTTIHLDPRPEFREGPLATLVFAALQEDGHEIYREAGIPPRNVRLLWPGEIREGKQGTEVFARSWAFDNRGGFLNASLWIMTFRVECDDGGCVLGHLLSQGHGDFHIPSECWDDFFMGTIEDRKKCSGIHAGAGSVIR